MIKALFLLYQLCLLSHKAYLYFTGVNFQALLYLIKLGKMDYVGNYLISIGVILAGGSVADGNFWTSADVWTSVILQALGIITLVGGVFLNYKQILKKVKKRIKEIKAFLTIK